MEDKNVTTQQYIEQSFLTVLIYLNNVEKGGETQFYDTYEKTETFQVTPAVGSAIVFLHEFLHQGNDVLQGVKYLLRTDICYRKKKDVIETVKSPSFSLNVTPKCAYGSLPQGNYTFSNWDKLYHPSCQHYTD